MVTMVTAPAVDRSGLEAACNSLAAWCRRSPPRLQAPGAAALFCLILVPSTALDIPGPLAGAASPRNPQAVLGQTGWFKSQGYLLGVSDLKQVNLVCCEFIGLAVESL